MFKKRDYETDVKPKLLKLGYIILSEDKDYIDTRKNLIFKCPSCGEVFERTPHSAFNGTKPYCRKCTQKNIVGKKLHDLKIDEKEVIDFFKNKNINYKLNGGYVTFKCVDCNKEVTRRWYAIKNTGSLKCEKCGKGWTKGGTKTKDIINEELKKLGSTTECIEDGKFTTKTRVKFKCGECGEIFERKPNTVLSNKMYRCNNCSHKTSSPEKTISEILNKNNISFEYQKIFEECRYKLPLPFDFYLTDYDILIEYDGIFHYKDIYGELEVQQLRDSIKNEFCIKNNKKLLRISYENYDEIEEIILNYIQANTVRS